MYDLKDALEAQVNGFGDRFRDRMYSLAGIWSDPGDDDVDSVSSRERRSNPEIRFRYNRNVQPEV